VLGPAFRISVAAALSAAIVPMPARATQRRSGPHAPAAGSVWRFTPSRIPSPARSPLKLSAVPESPLTGQPVRLAVLNPASAPAAYSWELIDGTQTPSQTPSAPQVTMRFALPGIHRVAVTVVVGRVARQATISILVRFRPATPAVPTKPAVATKPAAQTKPAVPTKPAVQTTRARRLAHHTVPTRPRAHAAADPGVTIADFHFTASSVTIHVGDTITWTNDGPSSHTATANNASFNTGVLKKGASASHTFTQPGTYTYFCQIHPFMHGTVVVLAAASSSPAASQPAAPASGSSSSPATSSPTATVAQSSGPTLPLTGFNVAAGALCGLLLVGLGLTLRRRILSR
jgi:plastocyanin